MEKKFYEMPEVEVIELNLKCAILGLSDGSGDENPEVDTPLPGEGDGGMMG